MQGTNKIVVFSSWVRAMMSSTHSVLFKSVPYLEFGISFKIYFQVNRRNQDYCILFFLLYLFFPDEFGEKFDTSNRLEGSGCFFLINELDSSLEIP